MNVLRKKFGLETVEARRERQLAAEAETRAQEAADGNALALARAGSAGAAALAPQHQVRWYSLVLWAFACRISHVPTRMRRLNRESIALSAEQPAVPAAAA